MSKFFVSLLVMVAVAVVGVGVVAVTKHNLEIQKQRLAAERCTELQTAARPQNVALAEKAMAKFESWAEGVYHMVKPIDPRLADARKRIGEQRQKCRSYPNSSCSEWAVTALVEGKHLIEYCQQQLIKHCPTIESWRPLWAQVRQIACN